MAISVESANLVRQKTRMITRNPGVFYGLKALFLHLAANKGNPDLKLGVIDGYATASDGTNGDDNVLSDGACTLYAIYLNKTGTTATYFKATNHATTSTTDGTQAIALAVTAADEELHLYPDGKAFSTGFTYTENTSATGHTGNLLADRIDGFAILGA